MRFFDSLPLGFLGLLAAASSVLAGEKVIYASSVEFCGENQLILLEKVNFRFYPTNSSVQFEIMANSVANNVSALLNFQLVAYGLKPVNVSIDLCEAGGGLLCPLPVYNYNGSATYIIPESYTKQIPSIAYYLPNLEANARLSIIDQNTGQEAACITAYLSNGLTTNHNYVSWAVGAVILIAFIICLINSVFPISAIYSGPDYRLLTAVAWLQHIVVTGMISVNYPALFQAFTRNFAWTFGLIYIAPLENDTIRKALSTGGLNETSRDAIGITNAINQIGSAIDSAIGNVASTSTAGPYELANVQSGTADSASVGIEQFVEKMQLSPATAFVTALVVFLMLAAIMLALTLLIGLGAFIVAKVQKKKRGESFVTLTRKHWVDFAALNGLRWFMVAFLPLVLLAVFTFRFENTVGYAFVAVAAVTFVLLLIGLAAILALMVLGRKGRNEPSEMYNGKLQRRMAPLFDQYKHKYWYSSAPIFFLLFVQAIFVGAGQRHPLVQLIPLIIIEVFILLFLVVIRPFQSKGSNALTIILSIGRLVVYGLLLSFLPRLNVNRIAVTVIGIVILVIQSVLFLVIFAVMLKQLILGIKWAIQTRKTRGKRISAFATPQDQEQEKSEYLAEKNSPIRDVNQPFMTGELEPPRRPDSMASSTTMVDSRPQSRLSKSRFSGMFGKNVDQRNSVAEPMMSDDRAMSEVQPISGYEATPEQQARLSNAYMAVSRPTSTYQQYLSIDRAFQHLLGLTFMDNHFRPSFLKATCI